MQWLDYPGESHLVKGARRQEVRRPEGDSPARWTETAGSAIKLTITHTVEHEPSKLIAAVSRGWPQDHVQSEIAGGDRIRRAGGGLSFGRQQI